MSDPHRHLHRAEEQSDSDNPKRLVLSIVLNLIITIAEIVGGLVSGSLALLSDALHNFSDTASLGISLAAAKIASRQPDNRKTYGYHRAQIIGAFINLITLVLIALFLIREAIERYFNPQPIEGQILLVVAGIGLLANLITAALLYRQSKENLNIRSAFVHIMGDAFSSVGVVIGGFLILRYQLYFVDALVTLLISLYILVHATGMLRQTMNILMQGVPDGIELDNIINAVKSFQGIVDIHHLHVWQMDENHASLEAHIVISPRDPEAITHLKDAIKTKLASAFDIHHSTLEFEFDNTACACSSECYEISDTVATR